MGENKIYIGRLDESCTEDNLREAFRPFGAIVRVDVKTGYGFVTFEEYSSCEAAMKDMQDVAIPGSAGLNVKPVKNREDARRNDGGGKGKGKLDRYRITIANLKPQATWMVSKPPHTYNDS